VNFWLPQIIDAFGYDILVSSLLTAVPYACGGLAMIIWGRRSDRRNERVKHTAFAAMFACVGLLASAFSSEPVWSMAFLSLATTGTLASMPAFWSLSTMHLGSADAAVGIAVINSIDNLAGFAGPYLVGWIKTATGDFSFALFILALGPLLTAAAVSWIGQSNSATSSNEVGDGVNPRPPRA
jgi:ACS family tartrate transporter-like MFS transporter